ncbi:MAG: site-specific integrase [Bacteroidota bacterium]
MASVNVVLRKKKNAKGLYPISVRITKNRKSSFLSTGQYIEEKYWDAKSQRVKKSHPNSTRLNNFILKKLAESNDKLLELEVKQKIISAQTITKEIKAERKSTSFFTLADVYIQQLIENGKFNQVNAERPRIKHFREFLKKKDIPFSEITVSLLKQFQAYLKGSRKVSDRTVANYMVVIRTIYNMAIREGIIEQKHYPFGRGGIVIKFPQSMKIGLTAEEVKALEEVELDDHAQWHARNVWLISFYFAGMRVSDVLSLKWSDIKDGRLYYRMAKNSKPLSLKVPEKAQRILSLYSGDQDTTTDLIFPELRKADLSSEQDIKRKIANATKVLNKHLGRVAEKLELNKPLKTHIARHTFGGLSGDKIPIQMLQKLYRHSDITTTINYQKSFILKDADEALETVLSSQ